MANSSGIYDNQTFQMFRKDKHADLLRLWSSKRKGRNAPLRNDFRVEELKPWLGRLILLDVLQGALPDGCDFKFRLMGSSIAQEIGADLTGRTVSESTLLAGATAALQNLRDICLHAVPRFRDDLIPVGNGDGYAPERLFLPLSEDSRSINMILLYYSFLRERGGRRLPQRHAYLL